VDFKSLASAISPRRQIVILLCRYALRSHCRIDNSTVAFYGRRVKQAKTTGETRKKPTAWIQVDDCLVRHAKSGRYYARFWRNGKAHWKALGTKLKTVADGKLATLKAEWLAQDGGAVTPDTASRWTVGVALDLLRRDVKAGKAMNENAGIKQKGRIAESTQTYRAQTIDALVRSWQEINGSNLRELEIRRIPVEAVERWAFTYRAQVSSGRFNATLGTLRAVIRYAREAGQLHRDPTVKIKRERIRKSRINAALPTLPEFKQIVATMRSSGHRTAGDAADFVELLAYTGGRSFEVEGLTWADVDFVRRELTFRRTKNGQPRTIPMNRTLAELLLRMKTQRSSEGAGSSVVRVSDVRASLTRACRSVGAPRITRHGLRGFFSTVCLQSGVDVRTASEWLGHQDGGKLLLETYAKSAGAQAAAKLRFDCDEPTISGSPQ